LKKKKIERSNNFKEKENSATDDKGRSIAVIINDMSSTMVNTEDAVKKDFLVQDQSFKARLAKRKNIQSCKNVFAKKVRNPYAFSFADVISSSLRWGFPMK
jgi:hypothetical protein